MKELLDTVWNASASAVLDAVKPLAIGLSIGYGILALFALFIFAKVLWTILKD